MEGLTPAICARDMNIRSYKSIDFEKVVEIYDLSKADEFAEEESNFKVIPLKEDGVMLKLFEESNIYVYEKDKILGFAGHKDNYISWLFVHPEHRRNKIAQTLIKYILSTVSGTISLNVAYSNLPARNLYERLGFSVKKKFEGKYQGKVIVVSRMECRL